jgi:CheY-like chemotaxis protein
MTSILIVEDDFNLQRTIARDLSNRGFAVHATDNVKDAVAHLEKEAVDVLLADLRVQDGDGMDVIRAASRLSARIRPILMSAFATARDHENATNLGAVRVLTKPFSQQQLIEAVQQAVESESGFRGSIHGLSLVDLLQMYHYGRRSVDIRVGGEVPGRIVLEGGEVVHAERGDVQGEMALGGLLSASTGSIQTAPVTATTSRSIDRNFESLLLDAVRVLDESKNEEDESWIERLTFSPPAAGGEAGSTHETETSETDQSHDTNEEREHETMGKIDDACKEVTDKVDGSVACGVVDLDSGMLLGIHNVSSYTQTLNEVVAAATMDLFRGPNVGRVEQMVRAHRGVEENGEHYFQEMHITSEHNYHFAKVMKGGRSVIMLVTKKSTNIGMGWAMLKSVIPNVEPYLP